LIGALEIGFNNKPNNNILEFLQKVVLDIGIAFHSLYVHIEMEKLLKK
jgi:hypothetical protein